ncbi:hypothetical protein HanRHA438_Chr11g0494161 [Helianthus annuus]|uniref:Uncharacterized protein n=1 Tax=Helianthus annuus TaxID=4232 RepID=A0A9K3N2L0_HELAN|nr:hypothetical protein HanXRQr2_Chr10g0419831 [Helianthus annuus]KAJ0688696.1 hypothetical protein HanOQP8_Chr11g0397161 [Helianthus annuus]KAJ0869896.1 hypothetical protein HanRHA438_Chr11g0494161 [Helianthus annuus]
MGEVVVMVSSTSDQVSTTSSIYMGERTKAINGDGYSLLVTPLVQRESVVLSE